MQHNISGANKKHDYYFSGMCVCNDCGSGMSGIIIKRKVKEKGYDCSKYRQYSTKACHCHEIKEKDILIHLKEFLKFTKQKYLKEIKDIKTPLVRRFNSVSLYNPDGPEFCDYQKEAFDISLDGADLLTR